MLENKIPILIKNGCVNNSEHYKKNQHCDPPLALRRIVLRSKAKTGWIAALVHDVGPSSQAIPMLQTGFSVFPESVAWLACT